MDVHIVYYNPGVREECIGVFANKQLAENKIKTLIKDDVSFMECTDDTWDNGESWYYIETYPLEGLTMTKPALKCRV